MEGRQYLLYSTQFLPVIHLIVHLFPLDLPSCVPVNKLLAVPLEL